MIEGEAPSPQLAGTLADDPLALAILIGSWWWGAWVNLCWPHAVPRHLPCQEGHCQLAVPEPIEACGEHGLFA